MSYNLEKIWGIELKCKLPVYDHGWSLCGKYKTFQSLCDAMRDLKKYYYCRLVKIIYYDKYYKTKPLNMRKLKLERIIK
jgi:hypothetical protein